MKVYKCDMNLISKLKKSCKNDITKIISNVLLLPITFLVCWLIISILFAFFETNTESPTLSDLFNHLLNEANDFDIILIATALICDVIIFINLIRKFLIKNNIIENLTEEYLQIFSDKIVFMNVINTKIKESLTYIEIPIHEIIRAECIYNRENQNRKMENFIKNLFTDPLISDYTNFRTIKIISKKGVFFLSIENSCYAVDEINSVVNMRNFKF